MLAAAFVSSMVVLDEQLITDFKRIEIPISMETPMDGGRLFIFSRVATRASKNGRKIYLIHVIYDAPTNCTYSYLFLTFDLYIN